MTNSRGKTSFMTIFTFTLLRSTMPENWSYITIFGDNLHVQQNLKVYKTLGLSTYNRMKNMLG